VILEVVILSEAKELGYLAAAISMTRCFGPLAPLGVTALAPSSQLPAPYGLNTTQLSFPASTVTVRNTFLPSISVPTV
jgi:hypothetical protein